MSDIARLVGVTLNTFDVDTLAAFYIDTLGFTRDDHDAGVALRLADVRVELVEVDRNARPCPREVAGWSPLFQHFAIIVNDMDRAMAALSTAHAWSPISRSGPERLPPATGSVTAFKFRDPEGHPLEFLMLPATSAAPPRQPFVRIDHSAISVSDVTRSIAFYEDLGLRVATRSLNSGIEQERLDDIDGATVDVIGLAPPMHPAPHVELLGYRGDFDRGIGPTSIDDIAASCLMFTVAEHALDHIADRHRQRIVARGAAAVTLRDPDGHLLTLRAKLHK